MRIARTQRACETAERGPSSKAAKWSKCDDEHLMRLRNTWGGECHKDLVVKPEDMSVNRQQFRSPHGTPLLRLNQVDFCWFVSIGWWRHRSSSLEYLQCVNDRFFSYQTQVYKGKKANIDSYSAFFDNCKANDTGLTKQLEDAGVTDVYCNSLQLDFRTCKGQADCKLCSSMFKALHICN